LVGDLSRRDFIKAGLGAAVAAAMPRVLFAAKPDQPEGPTLGIARGTNSKLVKAAVDLVGGIKQFVKPGNTVCVKPNISFAANIECGATTSPAVARQVVQLCLDAGAARVVLVDNTLAAAELCVEKSGIEQAVVDKSKVSLLTLSKERQFADVAIPKGKELKATRIAKVALESDVLINLPTAKSHSATGISLGMKNLMGLVWDRGVMHRLNLHQAIADLSTVIRPDLIILDATRALTSGGPGGPGKTVKLDTVIAGTDPVAVDSFAVGLTQWYNKSFTGKSVKYIVAAAGLGLGEIDTAKMNLKEVSV
jgi:uncharacterized protein (DUF362 family)